MKEWIVDRIRNKIKSKKLILKSQLNKMTSKEIEERAEKIRNKLITDISSVTEDELNYFRSYIEYSEILVR